MKLRIHNHISKKATPQKWEIAAWPAGKIIKEPEKAAAPEGITWATTSASCFGQTKLLLAGHYQPWSKLGKKKNSGVAENVVTKCFYKTCTGIPKLWYTCHQLYASHLQVILCCAARGTGRTLPEKPHNFLLSLFDSCLHKGYMPACLWQDRSFLNEKHLQMLCT